MTSRPEKSNHEGSGWTETGAAVKDEEGRSRLVVVMLQLFGAEIAHCPMLAVVWL
jgi:hypothetical protein